MNKVYIERCLQCGWPVQPTYRCPKRHDVGSMQLDQGTERAYQYQEAMRLLGAPAEVLEKSPDYWPGVEPHQVETATLLYDMWGGPPPEARPPEGYVAPARNALFS